MGEITDIIREEIGREGPMRFDAFMERALYHDSGGYYASGRAAIGRGGDFYTSVSVGDLFGALIAEKLAATWGALGRPASFSVIEQGADSGDLANDILSAVRCGEKEFADAVRYLIVEPRGGLRASQEERLGREWPGLVTWVNSLEDAGGVEGVYLANECLDAFPVRLVRRESGQWRERLVTLDDHGGFAWESARIDNDELARESPHLLRAEDFADGYTTEIRPAVHDWADGLARALKRGAALVIDYGYADTEFFSPERNQGTLRCYREHRATDDPLEEVGDKDLTAHVNFTRVAREAREAGFEVVGLADQSRFLTEVGVELLRKREGQVDPGFARRFQTLTHPGLMGRAFKVLGLSRGLTVEDVANPGFQRSENPCP